MSAGAGLSTGGVAQIYRLNRPLGALEQLTHDAQRVARASYEPKEGRYMVKFVEQTLSR